MRGRLYILRSPYHQQALIKIGRTSKVSEARAKELSSATGVPAEFEVLYEEEVHDAALAEELVHEQLHDYRVNQRREFFQLPLKTAIRTVFSVAARLHQIETGRAEARLVIRIEGPLDEKLLPKLLKILRPHQGGPCRTFIHYINGTAQAVLELGKDWRITLGRPVFKAVRKLGPQVSAVWGIGPANEVLEDVPF